jgi:hypothetical protein
VSALITVAAVVAVLAAGTWIALRHYDRTRP